MRFTLPGVASLTLHGALLGAALGVGWQGPPAETPLIEVEIVFAAPDSSPSAPAVPDAVPAEPLAGPSEGRAAPVMEDAPAVKDAASDARPAIRAARVPREARRSARTAPPAVEHGGAETPPRAAAVESLDTPAPMGAEPSGVASNLNSAVALSALPWQAAPRPGPSTPPAYGGNSAPVYPAAARRRGQQGQVVLRAEVGADGRPARVEVARSSGYALLDEAALASVSGWRFAPAEIDGKPSAGAVEVPITFKLVD